ncbi:MAG: hypothetical protein ABSA17_08495 [Rhabdochlamydiaceae bacterium]|jgi:hypothetical protein
MIDRIDRSWFKTNPLTPYISKDKIISWKALPILGLLGSALVLAYFLNQSRVQTIKRPDDLQLPGIHPTKLEKYQALIKKHLLQDESLGSPTKNYSEDGSQIILRFNEQVLIDDKDLIRYRKQKALCEERTDNPLDAFIKDRIEFLYKKEEHYIVENKNPDQPYDRMCKIVCVEGYYIPIIPKPVH